MMNIPTTFVRGITLEWTVSLSDYPASAWDLSYAFVNPAGKVEVDATADGDDFNVKVDTTLSAQFKAGRYDWQAYVTDGTDRYWVGSGCVKVIEDFKSTTGFDGRSILRQIVEAIDAYLLGNATNEQQKFKYKEREIWKHSRQELIMLREKLGRELAAEERRNNPEMKGSVIRPKIL